MVSAADFLAGNRHAPMSSLTSSSSSSLLGPASGLSSATPHGNLDDMVKREADLGAEGEGGRRRLSAEGSMVSDAATSAAWPDDFTSESSASSSVSTSTSTSTSESGGRKGSRGRRGRKSFKEWQDDSRWDLKVRLRMCTNEVYASRRTDQGVLLRDLDLSRQIAFLSWSCKIYK